MADTTLKYAGYTTTSYAKSTAGVEDDEEWTNADINAKIKAAELFINGETGLSWYPYDSKPITEQAPDNIKEATAFLTSALINGELKDKEKIYKSHLELAMLFLQSFVKNTTTQQFNARLRAWVLSDYLTSPANPDADPYVTGPIK